MDVSLFSDISSVLAEHWRLIAGILLLILLGQGLVWLVLTSLFSDRLSSDEHYSLSLAGWVLPISLTSVIWFAWGMFQRSAPGAFVVFGFLVVLALTPFLRTHRRPLASSASIFLLLLLLFGIFFFLRLAFVAKSLLPLYFDSAHHYLTIKNLLGDLASNQAAPFRWPTGVYYHIGFQLLSAMVTSTLRADVNDVMLILGQMIVATIPFSVFFPIKHETRSNGAGLFALFLAGFGWYMPAYTVNWGKYPALISLPLVVFVLSLAYLAVRYRTSISGRKYLALIVLLFSGILLTAFVHSRSLVIFGIIALSGIIVAAWSKLPNLPRVILVCAVLLGILVEISLIRTKDVFGPLFDPYWNRGLFITSLVLVLSLFAQKAYPRLTFACILAIFFLLGALFVPVSVPGYGELTLLDRPFVEMILYLPLALLGGAGLAGLEQTLQPLTTRRQAVRWGAGSVFIGLILVNALLNYTLYPSDCCSIVSRDDLVAIDWLDKHLPPEARILIASTELRVLASDSFQGAVNGDAGAWITPLTGRPTLLLPYHSDFSQQTTFDTLCQLQADYIYVGELGTRFNNAQIEPYPDRYQILLSMPQTKIYQVIGCK
jgi:hypothetical protein